MKDPNDEKKLSRYAKIPVAFAGTKLDKTDFIRSDPRALPRALRVEDLELWARNVHRRAENSVHEVSS